MGAPFDASGIGWAVHSLDACLTKLRDASSIKPKANLATILARSETAIALLSKPTEPPVVFVEPALTLWSCLIALEPSNADPKLCRSLGAVYFLVFSGYARPSRGADPQFLGQLGISFPLAPEQELEQNNNVQRFRNHGRMLFANGGWSSRRQMTAARRGRCNQDLHRAAMCSEAAAVEKWKAELGLRNGGQGNEDGAGTFPFPHSSDLDSPDLTSASACSQRTGVNACQNLARAAS